MISLARFKNKKNIFSTSKNDIAFLDKNDLKPVVV
jgi:hypothetical protein